MKNRNIATEVWNVLVWVGFGFLMVNFMEWLFPGIGEGIVSTFFIGAFTMFLGLTLLGNWKQVQQDKDKQAAMDQFIEDQKMDQEKQAKVDQEIVNQLRNEHQLSGKEQDQRLKALETALKYLRKK